MIFFPGCKINIGLDIIARRDDGYHDIETVMFPVPGLCDVLEIVPAGADGVEFSSSGLALDCPPEKNLCVRAYGIVQREFGIGGASIHLHKRIPCGAGLGGGSSDAAWTIRGLDKVFSLDLDRGRMERLAAEIGSDTAFFTGDGVRLARGRGEQLSGFRLSLADKCIVIVKPDISVSTAEAYSYVVPHASEIPLTERLSHDISMWRTTVSNGFENSIFAKHPILGKIKEYLYESGALYASMSGSGSALYGIFDRPTYCKQSDNYRKTDAESGRSSEFFGQLQKSMKDKFGDLFVYQQII